MKSSLEKYTINCFIEPGRTRLVQTLAPHLHGLVNILFLIGVESVLLLSGVVSVLFLIGVVSEIQSLQFPCSINGAVDAIDTVGIVRALVQIQLEQNQQRGTLLLIFNHTLS